MCAKSCNAIVKSYSFSGNSKFFFLLCGEINASPLLPFKNAFFKLQILTLPLKMM